MFDFIVRDNVHLTLDITVHPDADTAGRLARVESILTTILERINAMTPELQRLTEEVAENTTVNQSAITLIAGLAQQIRDLKDDPVAIAALADQLDAQNAALAAAVTANTPTP